MGFLIDFLFFAKTNGQATEQGWICSPSIKGIIRTWDGCNKMKYKPLMDWARESGVVEMIQEKIQSSNRTGKARTYALHLPTTDRKEWVLGRQEAIEYIRIHGNFSAQLGENQR